MPTSKEILAQIANQGMEVPVETPTPETPEPTEVPNNVETPTEPVSQATPEVASEGPIELEIPEPTSEAFDFQSFIKDIGIDAKDTEDFKTKVKELTLKEDPLKGLPDKVRKAVEFAQKGGDIYELLKISQVDYSQIDPVALYEDSVYSMARDKAKAKEYLENMNPTLKEIEGEKLRQEYIRQQEQQEYALRSSLEAKASEEAERRIKNEARLKESLKQIEDISGFKVKESQKDKFYKEVTSGQLSKRLFFDKDGNYDYAKMFKLTFLADHFDKIQKYYQDKVATQTKRETIEGLTNAQIDTPTGVPEINTQEQNPLVTWAQTMREKNVKRNQNS